MGQKGENYTRVVAIRQSNPCATLQTIANDVGLTRERVRQILNSAQLQTKHYITTYHCNGCGKEILKTNKSGYCNKCRKQHSLIPIVCDNCGKVKYRPAWRLIYEIKSGQAKTHLFCSKRCQGEHLAGYSGFGVHPENARQPGQSRKWDYGMVWQKHQETGYGAVRLSRLLNIPKKTVSRILHIKYKDCTTDYHTPWKLCNQLLCYNRIPSQHIKARWLKRLNFTDKEIATYLRCSKSTIHRALYRFDVVSHHITPPNKEYTQNTTDTNSVNKL